MTIIPSIFSGPEALLLSLPQGVFLLGSPSSQTASPKEKADLVVRHILNPRPILTAGFSSSSLYINVEGTCSQTAEGSTSHALSWSPVPGIEGKGCSALSLGAHHGLAIWHGRLLSFGFHKYSNIHSQLGRPTHPPPPSLLDKTTPKEVVTPTFVHLGNGDAVTHIAAGGGHSLVATYNQATHKTTLLSCGYGGEGQLGIILPEKVESTSTFQPVLEVAGSLCGLGAGMAHSLVWIPKGVKATPSAAPQNAAHAQLWGFGNTTYGQLGLSFSSKKEEEEDTLVVCRPRRKAPPHFHEEGGSSRVHLPEPVFFFEEHSLWITGVACGDYHTVVCTDFSNLFVFGKGTDGQLGLPMQKIPTPRPLSLGNYAIKGFSAGGTHTAVLAEAQENRELCLLFAGTLSCESFPPKPEEVGFKKIPLSHTPSPSSRSLFERVLGKPLEGKDAGFKVKTPFVF